MDHGNSYKNGQLEDFSCNAKRILIILQYLAFTGFCRGQPGLIKHVTLTRDDETSSLYVFPDTIFLIAINDMKNLVRTVVLLWLLASASMVHAGQDLVGPVQRVQIGYDGTLWFTMETTAASQFCRAGWNGMTMYIPKGHPEYPYYFAMLMTAVAKQRSVIVANISIYDGSISCDITKTNYGLVFM